MAEVAIFGAALASRAAWLPFSPRLIGDSNEYLQLAHCLATAGTFAMDCHTPSAYRPPLYPALLGVATTLSSHPIFVVLALQCVAGAVSAVLVMHITQSVRGKRAGLIAGAAFAVAPMSSYYATLVLTETFFVCVVMGAVLMWTRGRPSAAGVLLGLATLLRGILTPLLLLLPLVALVRAAAERRQLLRMTAAALLVVAPWMVRNGIELGRLTLADAGWGSTFLVGTVDLHPGSNRWTQINATLGTGSAPEPFGADERAAARMAIARIRANPRAWIRARAHQYPWLFIETGDDLPVAANQWSFADAIAARHPSTLLLKTSFVGGNLLLCLAAGYGVWVLRNRLPALPAIWLIPSFIAAGHLIVYVEPRYGLPIVPFLIIYAACGVDSAVKDLARWRDGGCAQAIQAPGNQTS